MVLEAGENDPGLELPWPSPSIDPEAWVADSAVVVGDVRLEAGASLWPTAVARGDVCPVVVGRDSNVQDGAVLHGDGPERTRVASSAVEHSAFNRLVLSSNLRRPIF